MESEKQREKKYEEIIRNIQINSDKLYFTHEEQKALEYMTKKNNLGR